MGILNSLGSICPRLLIAFYSCCKHSVLFSRKLEIGREIVLLMWLFIPSFFIVSCFFMFDIIVYYSNCCLKKVMDANKSLLNDTQYYYAYKNMLTSPAIFSASERIKLFASLSEFSNCQTDYYRDE